MEEQRSGIRGTAGRRATGLRAELSGPDARFDRYPIKLTFAGPIPKLNAAAKLLWQAQARDIAGAADRSTYGLTADGGVLLLDVPAGSAAAKAGLTRDDVIIACNTVAVKTIDEVGSLADKAAGGKLDLTVIRKGKQTRVEVSDYTYGG